MIYFVRCIYKPIGALFFFLPQLANTKTMQ